MNNFTVIVPSKHLDDLTRNCLSCCRELYPDIQIILILNQVESLSDESAKFLDSLSIESHLLSNATIGRMRNYAAANSVGDYLAFIDSDAYPQVGWLESASGVLRGNTSNIITGPNINFPDASFQQSLTFKVTFSPFVSGGSSWLKNKNHEGFVTTASSCNLIVCKHLYISNKGMDEELITGANLEFCHRMTKKGEKIFFSKETLVFHRNRNFKGFLLQRFVWGHSSFALIKKSADLKFIYTLLPGIVALLAITSFFFLPFKILLITLSIIFLLTLIDSLRLASNFFHVPFLLLLIWGAALMVSIGNLRGYCQNTGLYFYYKNND